MKELNNNINRETIESLNELGKALRNENDLHRDGLRSRLLQGSRKTGYSARPSRIQFGRFLFPSLSIAAIAVIAIISATYRPVQYFDEPYPLMESGITTTEVASDMFVSEMDTLDAPSLSSEVGLGAPTFRSRFLGNIGRHNVSQDKIEDYRAVNGDLFERNVNIRLMSKAKDAFTEISTIYTNLDGYIERANENTRNSYTIVGRIPAQNISALRSELRSYVGSDDFYTESSMAYNRVPDAVVIDENIQEVIDAIALLEERIANETNANVLEKLNEDLKQHNAYLNERKGTKDDLMERVEYVDISITITKTPNWFESNSYWELSRSISGFDSPDFGQRFMINVLYMTTRLITFFSYTFWIIIPALIWWVVRRKRQSIFAGLD